MYRFLDFAINCNLRLYLPHAASKAAFDTKAARMLPATSSVAGGEVFGVSDDEKWKCERCRFSGRGWRMMLATSQGAFNSIDQCTMCVV
jgi:hypothetical protein